MTEGSNGGKPYLSDTEITVDRDDIPHYTGAVASLMKEYIRRVIFAFGGLEGEGKDAEAEAEAADLLKKQCRFGRRLIDALHGEAWRAVAHLVMQPEKLRKKDGFEEVLAAFGSIEKEGVIRKTEAFVKFFEPPRGNKGEAIDAYWGERIRHGEIYETLLKHRPCRKICWPIFFWRAAAFPRRIEGPSFWPTNLFEFPSTTSMSERSRLHGGMIGRGSTSRRGGNTPMRLMLSPSKMRRLTSRRLGVKMRLRASLRRKRLNMEKMLSWMNKVWCWSLRRWWCLPGLCQYGQEPTNL